MIGTLAFMQTHTHIHRHRCLSVDGGSAFAVIISRLLSKWDETNLQEIQEEEEEGQHSKSLTIHATHQKMMMVLSLSLSLNSAVANYREIIVMLQLASAVDCRPCEINFDESKEEQCWHTKRRKRRRKFSFASSRNSENLSQKWNLFVPFFSASRRTNFPSPSLESWPFSLMGVVIILLIGYHHHHFLLQLKLSQFFAVLLSVIKLWATLTYGHTHTLVIAAAAVTDPNCLANNLWQHRHFLLMTFICIPHFPSSQSHCWSFLPVCICIYTNTTIFSPISSLGTGAPIIFW